MTLSVLKKIRVIVSLVFLLATTIVFLDFRNIIPDSWIKTLLYFQFIPSLLNFFSSSLAIAASGFIVILVLSFLFGRIYCSFFCPLGTMMDIISRISEKFKKRKIFRFSKARNLYRYGFLGLTIIFLFMGTTILVNLLDPFSNYGRIAANIGKPLLLYLNNGLSFLLEKMNIYTIYREEFILPDWTILLFPLSFLMLIIYFATFHGRLYCNTVCPVGTILGLLSRFSLFKIKMFKTSCTSCGDCSSTCKASCIDIRNCTVDMSRCVACYNCLSSCPEGGISYELSGFHKTIKQNPSGDKSKRKALQILFTFLIAAIPLKSMTQGRHRRGRPHTDGTIPIHKKHPVTPPGSKGLFHFTTLCTSCHLCVTSCPTKVLQPSLFEYGFEGILQPHLDSNAGFCNYDCVICGQVCPSAAIHTLTLTEKHKTQIGKVQLVLDNCVVFTRHKDCGSCAEHCPTQAVHMIPWKKNLKIPEINNEICVGCGACEYACPTKPYKAIYVEGNPIHLIAKKAESKQTEQIFSPKEDFPF